MHHSCKAGNKFNRQICIERSASDAKTIPRITRGKLLRCVRLREIEARLASGFVWDDRSIPERDWNNSGDKAAARVGASRSREIIFQLLNFTPPKFLARLETQNRGNIRLIEFSADFSNSA